MKRQLPQLLWCLAASVAAAERPEFIFPVDCDYGIDCVIQNYVDNDPTEAYREYQCGQQTYDGHTGTDIRIINLPQMNSGVAVLAAADGKVVATRDGVADTYLDRKKRDEISKTGLGNAVVIEHPNGWRTIYGHLKEGSLMVQKGDIVTSEQKLGDIGLSGLTEFPHVHFQVQYLGQTTDPFTGIQRFSVCGDNTDNLWSMDAFKQVTYEPGFLLDHGFNDQPPANYKDIESGEFNNGIDEGSDHLFFWVRLIGLAAGSQITLNITSPDNETVKSKTFDKLKTSKAQIFYYVGIKNPEEQSGNWVGELILKQPSLPKSRKSFSYTNSAF
ncbi:M23 family metallopeptidase [Endozoicomonas elysicola]|uniref:M23 family metallopeptidase n=1 Tax=Endozoicomonas elysicola TaxID=305900 RepID=UPI0003739D1C|nr:M23 family metallopeptidase [Endozoicomonas elysicola]